MKEVQTLLKARCDCIWINTYEEADVIKDLREIVQKEHRNMKFYVWSNTEGLKSFPIVKGEKTEEPNTKLREIPALFASIRANLEGTSNDQSSTGAIYVLRDLHNLMADPRTRRCIRDIKEYQHNKYMPLIVIAPVAEVHEEIARLFKVVDYELPNKSLIYSLVKIHNNRMIDAVENKGKTEYKPYDEKDFDVIVNACVGLTVKEIDSLLLQSIIKYKTFNLEYILQDKIEAVKKSGMLDYKQPAITLDDIGGHRVLKDYLLEVKEQFTPAARDFGLEMPKGILMLGVAGAGKSMAAEAFAGTLQVPLLTLNMAKVMSRFVGDSEQKIERALSIAKAAAPCVLLLDEAEKNLAGQMSSSATDSGIVSRIFQSILRFMQDNDKGVYIMLTCNDASQLPPEFTRAGRLDSQWFFDLPNESDRKEIFKVHFKRYGRIPTSDIINMAVNLTTNFTGAEIAEVVKNTMRKAFLRTRKSKTVKKDIILSDITSSVNEVTPVYDSNRERIMALRNWVKGRARFTDGSEEKEMKRNDPFDPLSGGLSL